MTYQISAEDLEYAAYESDDFDPDNLRYDYSGRAMYGRTCLAIVGEFRDLGAFMATVITQLYKDHEDLEIPTRAWGDLRQDSMGLQSVFYWPQINVIKTDDTQVKES